MTLANCKYCQYFDEYDDAPELSETWKEDDTIGKCKRYPPVLLFENKSRANDYGSPSVRSSDWCGEFRPTIVGASD